MYPLLQARLWADMCNLKTELVHKIDKLERNFAVSNVIFKKYQPIFVDLFRDPAEDPPKPVRSRKQKRPPCTSGEVFDFCSPCLPLQTAWHRSWATTDLLIKA